MGNAGRVLMIPKGDYNAATTYERLDFVYYQGRSYVCKQTSTGNAPTNTTYWQALTGDASAEIQALTNQLTDEVTTRAELGAHNLLRVDLALCKADTDNNGTWASNVYSKNSVDITVYDDGQIKINGTPSATFAFVTGKQPIGNIASGMKYSSGGASTSGKYAGTIDYYNSSLQYISQQILTDGVALTVPSNSAYFRYAVVMYKDKSADNVVFKSMLRLATDADPTYQPYAKTNVELTQESAVQTATWKDSTTNFDFTVTKKNGICILCNSSSNGSVVSSGAPVEVGTIPTGFRPSTETRSMGIFGDSAVFAVIATTGGSLRFGTWSQKTISNAFFEIVYPCAE